VLYRTPEQLDIITGAFATVFPGLFTRELLPHSSIGGLPIYATRMRGGKSYWRRTVLITGGLHARELMNPDAIVDLLVDLCVAYQNGTGISYGNRTWTDREIKSMVESLDIWMIPCVNPDGRQRVMDGDCLWRKNIRDNEGTTCEGVDVNRNFDGAFGIVNATTACYPCSLNYHGKEAFSEPESQNIRDFCDAHQIHVAIDVHSYMGLVLYPWGHAPTQVADSSKRFTTLVSERCKPLNPPDYKEYMPRRDQRRYQTVAQRVVDSISTVPGQTYRPMPTHSLYGASGTCSDYLYGRHIADPALQKTYAFALETGPDTGDLETSFHPEDPVKLSAVKRDAKVAILTLIEQSVCAIEQIGASLTDHVPIVEEIRSVRDDDLMSTEPGSEWVELFDRIQGPILSEILSDQKLTAEAVSLFERAVVMIGNDSAKLTARDVAQASALLKNVSTRLRRDELRRDIDLVQDQLVVSQGRTRSQILAGLRRDGPGINRRRKGRPVTARD
jgi:murein tripeptide amidase MpaA